MANEAWPEVRLGNLCKLQAGSVFPPALQGKAHGTYPFAKVSDMNLAANMFCIRDANNWVDDADLQQMRAKPFPAGTTVFAKIGEGLKQNRLRYLVRETVIDNNMMGATPDTARLDPRFFVYALSRFNLGEIAGGTALPYLTVSALSDLTLPLPPLPEQRAIAHTLGALDDKIELNRRMSETLEAMARAIFKSWFEDFDPVRAKAEGRQPFGMDAETAALFPDSFQDSPLGKIPKRWHIGKMKEFVRLNRNSINPSEHPDEVFDHYSIPAFDEGRLPKAEKGEQVKSNKFFVPGCAVLLSKLNPRFPRVWLPAQSGVRRSICSTEFLVTTPYAFATSDYLYGIFRSDAFHAEFATLVTGTSSSHQRVKAEFLLEMDSVIPEERLVAQFSEQCTPLLSMVAANLEESQTLAATRDALLPKLISGEIRVKDAEQSTKVPT
jgi:type I restriction enzyme S subunit